MLASMLIINQLSLFSQFAVYVCNLLTVSDGDTIQNK